MKFLPIGFTILYMKKVLLTVLALSAIIFSSCGKKTSGQGISRKFDPRSGVYYTLFVRSFADSNGDGIGDFNGIVTKLDYLENLGITGIMLLPVYKSHSYHGYDVDDYYEVNPEYGSLEDFARLCDECRRRSIAVILDIPLNNSSKRNKWFIDSIDPKSPKRSWYRWTSANDPEIGLKGFAYGHRVWNEMGGDYYSGLFSEELPDFNHDNHEVREEFKKVLEFWLLMGASGFCFDSANHLYDAVKIPFSVRDGQERAIQFWSEMTSFVLSKCPGAYIVGEVWDTDNVRAEYMRGLPSTFHFDLGPKIISTIKTADSSNNAIGISEMNSNRMASEKNPDFIDAPFLTNHDQNRPAQQFKNDPDLIKLAASMYLFVPGIPFVYYGEELGMNGNKPDEQIHSPFVWSRFFSSCQTKWMESVYNEKTVPADRQDVDSNSILNYYRRAISFRVQNKSAFKGALFPEKTQNQAIVSWIIVGKGPERIWCFFNVSQEEQVIERPDKALDANILFSQKNGASLTKDTLRIPSKSAVVFGVLAQ